MNFYESLGVKPSATATEIHVAYRRKAKKVHPDYNRRDSAFYEMVELNLIRDTMLNPEKRRLYDAQIHQQNLIHTAQKTSTRPNILKQIHNFFTYRCRICSQKMSSTWQGYCLFHFLEVSGQMHNPDQTFIYHGVKYTWQTPDNANTKENDQNQNFSPLSLSLYIILCLVVAALIIYNIYNLWFSL